MTALVGTTSNHNIIWASHALLDFVHLAQYHSHTDETLQALQDTLSDFHSLKDVFISLGCRKHFNMYTQTSLAGPLRQVDPAVR